MTSNLTNCAVSGYVFASARDIAIADIKRAILDEKQDYKRVRNDFVAGQMAKALFPDLKRAEAIAKAKGVLGMAGHGRTPKAGQAVRDASQEQAYTNARQWWSSASRDAGVAKPRKAAPRNAKKAKKAAPKAKGAAPKMTQPKVKSAAEATAHVLNMAKMISGFVAKNRDVVSPELSALVADFVGKVAAAE